MQAHHQRPIDTGAPAPRFLIVEDDEFMAETIAVALGRLGFNAVEMATNGEEALARYNARPESFEIVISDLNMPGMDGVEFLRHLKNQGFGGAVTLVSGAGKRVLDSVEYLAKAHGLNVLGVLEKPITLSALSEVLGRYDGKFKEKIHRPIESVTEVELRHAIHAGELTMFYQPVTEMATGKMVGVESLVRWIHPYRGIISPIDFVSLAEKTGLIEPLTDSVVRQALKQGGHWHQAGLDMAIHVNLSMNNLHRLDLPEFLEASTVEAGLKSSDVVLEVTESQLAQDLNVALEVLNRLRLKGFNLSIDDFGTGYSSMEQLKQIPFNSLKIDRSFVTGAATNEATRAILESSVELARKLEMEIVAEGVETQEDWDLVKNMGCQMAQGYFIAKPMPGEQVEPWLNS
ncbi:MAG: EAL domain-containing response regulator [Sedimenticola sp.]